MTPGVDGATQARASRFYFDRRFSLEAVRILPGQYFVSGRDMVMATVLGSCVAACIRDPATGIGGMNHFMLPDGDGWTDQSGALARYGTFAMKVLIDELSKLGAHPSRLEAKVFGAGNMFQGTDAVTVGTRNAAFIMEFLARRNIVVLASDLLDDYARKVCFFPRTGRAMVRRLGRNCSGNLLRSEQAYRTQLESAACINTNGVAKRDD